MASNEYMIPWKPLDISPGAAFVTSILNQNRQNDRADEYLRLQQEAMRNSAERTSHEVEREKEREAYRRRVEAFNAMPMLQRAASRAFEESEGRSFGFAGQNPYGIKFEGKYNAPDQAPADAAVSNFLNAPPPQPKPAPHALAPGEEGPVYQPTAEELMEQSTTGEPMDLMSQAAAKSFGPAKRQITATLDGQSFEVPEQKDTTGFGPKYDAVYQRALQEPGVDPEEAFKMVAKMAHEDTVESGRETRASEAEAGRDRRFVGYHMNVEEQFKKLQAMLAQSDINSRRAAAARIQSTPVVNVPPAQMAALSQYATENPGDQPGLYRKADEIGVPSKAVGAAIGQAKSTESQTRDAQQAQIGLRALDAIERSGYRPDRATIQKWMNNRRWTTLAEGEGAIAAGAGVLQTVGILPQSEVEGLPPEAQEYFAQVRRFIETIARKQSGAAISQSEWANFFNQFGPNSRGGLEAARAYLLDQMRSSGIAGRQLGAGGGAPSSQAGVGETKTGPDGKTYRKVGPNNWQPVGP